MNVFRTMNSLSISGKRVVIFFVGERALSV